MIGLGCSSKDSSSEDYSSYVSSIQEWHQGRIESLKNKNGILSVMGIYWLKEGDNSFGSDSSNDIIFPKDKSPDFIGSFTLNNGEVRMKVKPGIEVLYQGKAINEMDLQSDIESEKTILNLGTLSWFIIERNADFGVRLRDSENPRIHQLKDIETFKIDPAWRFEARFEPYEQPKTISMVTEFGAIRKMSSPGALLFTINNNKYRLEPMTWPNIDRYLLIFGDMTNGDETYGGGRFLFVEKPGEDGTTIIDFNKSINPPCAISEFYACPLPPPQNRLTIKVTAGEKKYEGLKY
jgi:hypothetical protein